MSRLYGVTVRVDKFGPDRKRAIITAANAEWPFEYEPLTCEDGAIAGRGDDFLYAGESEEEFVERFAKAIWTANGAYCSIEIDMAYLETTPPEESYSFDEADYKRLLGNDGQ